MSKQPTQKTNTNELLQQIADNTRKTSGYLKQFLNLSFVLIILVAAAVMFVLMRG